MKGKTKANKNSTHIFWSWVQYKKSVKSLLFKLQFPIFDKNTVASLKQCECKVKITFAPVYMQICSRMQVVSMWKQLKLPAISVSMIVWMD